MKRKGLGSCSFILTSCKVGAGGWKDGETCLHSVLAAVVVCSADSLNVTTISRRLRSPSSTAKYKCTALTQSLLSPAALLGKYPLREEV